MSKLNRWETIKCPKLRIYWFSLFLSLIWAEGTIFIMEAWSKWYNLKCIVYQRLLRLDCLRSG